MSSEAHYPKLSMFIDNPKYIKVAPEELVEPEHLGIQFSEVREEKHSAYQKHYQE